MANDVLTFVPDSSVAIAPLSLSGVYNNIYGRKYNGKLLSSEKIQQGLSGLLAFGDIKNMLQVKH